MSSDLNLNLNNSNMAPLAQTETDTTVNTPQSTTPSPPPQTKDSLTPSEQPVGPTISLIAYTANTSRPVLPKPAENLPKGKDATHQGLDVANRDLKSEHDAGSMAASNTQTGQTTEEQPVTVDGQQKKPKDEQQGNQGGSGGEGQGGKGGSKKEGIATMNLQDIVSQLSTLEDNGQIQPFDGDQIAALLNGQLNADGTKKATPAPGTGTAAATGEATAPTDTPEVALPEITVNGNVISGPLGNYTIPGPVTPPKAPIDMLTNSYNQLKGIADAAQAALAQMPESPDKLSLSNFMKAMVTALTQFQQYLYVINNSDSKTIRERSQAQLETSLHKLDVQRQKQEEAVRKAREAGQKGGIMGIIGKVFGAVGISMSAILVVLAVVLMCTGVGSVLSAVLLSVTIAFLVVSITSMIVSQATGKGVFERAFDGIGKLIGALLDAMGITGAANEWITLVLKIVVVVLVCAIVIAGSPIVFLFGGVSNIIGFITESGVINAFVKQCGGDEKAQMITTVVITATIMMTTMLISIVMMFIPGAQGALLGTIGSAVTNVTKVITTTVMAVLTDILKVTEKVAEVTTKVMMAMLKLILNPGFWMTVSMLGLQTVDTVNKVKMNYLLADLAKLQGEITNLVETTDALIAMFKKIIQKLLESLTDMGTFISQTSEVLKKYFQGQSETVTNLFSA